ncbi:hypothetical protein RUM43_010713 [Polyplax serrata]|uniref:Uncharacterized protein n=1 Tax=Polyplax serrata TaxID=468196 RepID=A0AAN8P4G0_POLSC
MNVTIPTIRIFHGLRSYGKVVYVFSVLPVFGVLIISSKLLGLTSINRGLFPQTEWSEFFLNAKSWISAGTEVMLTWNLLGVAIMQVTSHNRSSRKLWRDVAAIILLTLVVLILAAFLGNLCHQLISIKGYSYVPSSFERVSTYSFLQPTGGLHVYSYGMPVRHLSHASLMAGERVGKPEALHESGYQVLRLATELVPATLAILDGNYLSPFWAVLFYFTLILFGIAQQLAIWHCVITGIMAINAPVLKSWETTITFFTCAAGFILGLPMTTELGIFVVYFLDYCLGGGWWVVLLTLMEICAILMIRGRPYSGENISIALFGKSSNCSSLWAVPLLTFTWNVILPVALLVMSITIFKNGGYRDLWIWKCGKGDYWPLWTREVGVFVQMIPLLCIPVIGLVQCYRYLSKGPADIFDRLANLYRPATNIRGIGEEDSHIIASNLSPIDSGVNNTTELPVAEDPPPKYTPPPSYSTATGIRIAKLLRQSFRRSVRRIQTVLGPEVLQPPRPPPPDYDSVLVEINGSRSNARNGNSVSSPPPSSETNTLTAADHNIQSFAFEVLDFLCHTLMTMIYYGDDVAKLDQKRQSLLQK